VRVEKDFEEFVELLNKHKVRYLIVGAYAVSYYARPRNTGDIDILLEPTPVNAKRVLAVLEEFGFRGVEVYEDDLLNPDIVIELGYEPNRIDLLTSIQGVSFSTAYWSRVSVMFGRQKASMISLAHLIQGKQGQEENKMKPTSRC
jgi:hypothetical protein